VFDFNIDVSECLEKVLDKFKCESLRSYNSKRYAAIDRAYFYKTTNKSGKTSLFIIKNEAISLSSVFKNYILGTYTKKSGETILGLFLKNDFRLEATLTGDNSVKPAPVAANPNSPTQKALLYSAIQGPTGIGVPSNYTFQSSKFYGQVTDSTILRTLNAIEKKYDSILRKDMSEFHAEFPPTFLEGGKGNLKKNQSLQVFWFYKGDWLAKQTTCGLIVLQNGVPISFLYFPNMTLDHVRVIPDVNGDGLDDVLVVSSNGGDTYKDRGEGRAFVLSYSNPQARILGSFDYNRLYVESVGVCFQQEPCVSSHVEIFFDRTTRQFYTQRQDFQIGSGGFYTGSEPILKSEPLTRVILKPENRQIATDFLLK
jgi:hypothetical protein